MKRNELLRRTIYAKTPQDGTRPGDQVAVGEVMFADPRRIFSGQPTVYNPSILVGKHGIQIFDKMRRDDQVKAAMAFKKYAVISTGWEIIPPKDEVAKKPAGKKKPLDAPPQEEDEVQDEIMAGGEEEEGAEPGKTKPFAFPPKPKTGVITQDKINEEPGEQPPEMDEVGVEDPITLAVRENFEALTDNERTLDDMLVEIMSAMEFGFSVSEKILLDPQHEDNDSGRVWLQDIKTRRPHEIEFQQDVHGNLTGIFQEAPAGEKVSAPMPNSAYGAMLGNKIPVPRQKVVVYVHGMEFQNYYGTSDLEAAYRPWVVKDNAYKWLAMYLEKLGIPPIFAMYNPQSYIGQPLETLKQIINNMQAATFGIMPRQKEQDLEFWSPELGSQTSSVFIPAIDMFNRDIARAVLIPSLLGFTADTQQGSYARSQTHFDVFIMAVEYVRKTVASAINAQVIRPLVIMNFGKQKKYPTFKFLPLDDSLRAELLKTWQTMIAAGAVTKQKSDEEHIRRLLKMPERQEGDEMPTNSLPTDPLTGLPLQPGEIDPRTGQPVPEQPGKPKPKLDENGKPVLDKDGKPVMEEPDGDDQEAAARGAGPAARGKPTGKGKPAPKAQGGKETAKAPTQDRTTEQPTEQPQEEEDDSGYLIDETGVLVGPDGQVVLDSAGKPIKPKIGGGEEEDEEDQKKQRIAKKAAMRGLEQQIKSLAAQGRWDEVRPRVTTLFQFAWELGMVHV